MPLLRRINNFSSPFELNRLNIDYPRLGPDSYVGLIDEQLNFTTLQMEFHT